jgi:hypothetical protein
VGEILVGRPKLLTVDHRRKLFAEMPVEGLAYLAYHLRTKLGAAAEKAPILWRKRIKACFDRWPTLLEKNTPRVRQALAEMLLETREAFPETFAFLQEKGLLGQTSEPGAILYRLDRDEQRNAEDSPPYDYIGQHPVEILNLLDVIIPDRPEYWDINDLQKILGRITTAKLGMENSATFVRLQNLTHRG